MKNEVENIKNELLKRVRQRRIIGVKEILENKEIAIDFNSYDANTNSPLIEASIHGCSELIQYLLEKGADIEAKSDSNYKNKSGLLIAAEKGFVDSVRVFVENNSNLDVTDSDNQTALMLSSINGYLDIVEFLLNKNADTNVVDGYGRTALIYAIVYGNSNIAKKIIEKGTNVNICDHRGATPLIEAAYKGNFEIVNLLLSQPAIKVDKPDINGITALMQACESGYIEIVKLLLDKNVNILLEDNKKRNALYYAEKGKHTDILNLLNSKVENFFQTIEALKNNNTEQANIMLQTIENIDIQDNSGLTLLMAAAFYSNQEIAFKLLKKGANIHLTNKNNATILHFAAIGGSTELFSSLLKTNIDINAQNHKGITPLHYAAKSGNSEIIEALLKKNAKVNITDINGNTPLLYAAEKGYFQEFISLFMATLKSEKQLDTAYIQTIFKHVLIGKNFKTIEFMLKKNTYKYLDPENTGIFIAIDDNDISFINFLLNYIENINTHSFSNNNDSPLIYSCRQNRKRITEILLEKGANVNAVNKIGETALNVACQYERYDLVKSLLEAGSQIGISDDTGKSSFLHSIKTGNTNIIRLLIEYGVSEEEFNLNTSSRYFTFSNYDTIKLLINLGGIIGNDILLFISSYEGDFDAVKKLLPSANYLKTDYNGYSALLWGVFNNQIEVVKLMLAHFSINFNNNFTKIYGQKFILWNYNYNGNNIITQNNYYYIKTNEVRKKELLQYRYALKLTVKNNNHAMMRELLNYEYSDSISQSYALFEAVMAENIEMVDMLLNSKADVNFKPQNTNMILVYAIELNNNDIISSLLNSGAYPNAIDSSNKSVLMKCVEQNNTNIIKLLLEYDVDACWMNNLGETALSLAQKNNNSEIVELFTLTK